MNVFNLADMTKGWFVGDFDPSIYKTQGFEVGVKFYTAGDKEAEHYHLAAQEITVVVSGKVKMCNRVFEKGSIVVLEPKDITSFEALEDSCLCVVKVPSVKGDKYLV